MSQSSVNLTKPALMKEWAPITLHKKSKQALQQKRHLLDKAMLDLPLMSSQLSIQKQQIETELLELEIYVDWFIAKSKPLTMYPIGYRMTLMNYLIQKTEEFDNWLLKLRDRRAKAKIIIRLQRVQEGNFGDHKSVGGGVSELRITEGAGYRLYYTIQGDVIVIMLAGGDKSTQQQDIEKAKQLKDNLNHD